ncbi:MAG: signal peptidase I [Cyanobacteria bacterium P01_G01_bin.38]
MATMLLLMIGGAVFADSQVSSINRRPQEDFIAQSSPFEDQDLEQFRQDFETRFMQSGSMEPTLEVGDKVLVDKHTYRSSPPQRGDIVIYSPPSSAQISAQIEDSQIVFLHRIVGIPGETIEVRNGQTYVDDSPLDETYLAEPPAYQFGPMQLSENAYLILGDNRNSSYDGHVWGELLQESIVGKVIGIYCPVERQTGLDSQPLRENNQAIFSEILSFFKESPSLCSIGTEGL